MADLKTCTLEDLMKTLSEKRDTLRTFRFEEAGSRTRNVRAGRNLRKEIAQLLTEIRMRDLPAGKAGIASKAKNA